MAHVLLYLYGLVAFLPNGDRMTVVLPDAQYPATASIGCAMPAHVPAVLFRVGRRTGVEYELCRPENGNEDCAFDVPPVGGDRQAEFGGWLLDGAGYRLEIDGATVAVSALPGESPAQEPRGSLPTTADEAASFRWSPRMATVRGKKSPVMSGCLEDGGTCPSVVRLDLPNVAPRTCHLTADKDLKLHAFAFTKLTRLDFRRSRQAVADINRIALGIDGGRREVRLKAIPLAPPVPGVAVKEVTLMADADGEVEIHLVNLPSSEYRPSSSLLCPRAGADLHYELYFQLLEDSPPVQHRRVAKQMARHVDGMQPVCSGLSIQTDLFFTDFIHEMDDALEEAPTGEEMHAEHIEVPRFPPACPPAVF